MLSDWGLFSQRRRSSCSRRTEPPSTTMSWPVIKEAASDARKRAVEAMSWDVPGFAKGTLFRESSRKEVFFSL